MKLLIADDHTLFRDALVQYIRRAEPGAKVILAKDFYETESLVKKQRDFDLVLLDFKMPGMFGFKGLVNLVEAFPDLSVAIMSGVAEDKDVDAAFAAGAVGYFPKTLSGKALLQAIQQVLSGQKFIPHEENGIRHYMPAYYDDGTSYDEEIKKSIDGNTRCIEPFPLTPREREVLSYVVEGRSNKEIARELGLQEVTVKLHMRGICKKLDVKNRTQAALKARDYGVQSPGDQL